MLYGAIVRDAIKLDEMMKNESDGQEVVFGLFHDSMVNELKTQGRIETRAVLVFWREVNKKTCAHWPFDFQPRCASIIIPTGIFGVFGAHIQ